MEEAVVTVLNVEEEALEFAADNMGKLEEPLTNMISVIAADSDVFDAYDEFE